MVRSVLPFLLTRETLEVLIRLLFEMGMKIKDP